MQGATRIVDIGITSDTEFHFSKLQRPHLPVNESKLSNIFTVDASQLDLTLV
jgi:hypothetical protein